ncbi:MAG TPA: YfjI family protein [Hydrogenophaga sp.]|uniref:YfjI family protein n=1 Tax=Hydrogenophaga sp. TaxID=1904254 RepID=UPI002CE73589|nr:YfjI family protein [Hydrogenophaga sp.]HMN92717.1 YfjI family protein [Hydrogenophaga sp.]HMP08875.1 YfjI family protein [Hydrogenophaga sp.]
MSALHNYQQLVDELDAEDGISPWPPLQPIEDANTKAERFPHDALGKVLGAASRAIAEDVQAPDSVAGGSVLSAAALAVSQFADIAMPHGQRAPLSLYVLTGAASGERKSATDSVACYEIEEFRKNQARSHAEAVQRWEAENAERKKSEKPPPQPAAQALTTSNATIEGITKLLKQQSAVGVFSSEGGEMLGGHSLREDRRVSGLSFYLKAWGAERLDSLRGGEGLTVLLGRRVSLHVLVQPVILGPLLADPIAQGQGLLARCLIAQPDTLAGTRLFRACNPLQNPAVVAFNERVRKLLNRVPRTWDKGDGFELKPATLRLNTQATAAWVEFYNQVELAQAPGSELSDARPFASKAAEHAARIAGVRAMFEGSDQVDVDQMIGGIELASFYMAEHLRLTGAGQAARRNAQLKALLDWMQKSGAMNTATVLQKSPRAIRKLKAKAIHGLLAELEQRGYIRPLAGGLLWEVRDVET